jgi:hypothetical protein
MPYSEGSPVRDESKIVEQLESLALLTNFATATFNQHIAAVYWKKTKEHITAKTALTIKPSDTAPIISLKIQVFFLSLNKLDHAIEEKVLLNQLFAKPKDPDIVTATIRLRPKTKYHKDGQPIGNRVISVPHIDESKLGDFRDFRFTHGEVKCIYTFADKKQIKVLALNEELGIEAIQRLLVIVDPKWILGTAKEHCYVGKFSPNTAKSVLHGVTSTAFKIEINPPEGSSYTLFL